MRYAILVSYDGTEYAGWQRQKNAVSVQEVLEDAFYSAFSKRVKITASGRTDAGVHALGQVCHFDAELSIPKDKLPEAVNKYLPNSIRILKSTATKEDFNANKTAKRKTYLYRLYFSSQEIPLLERFAVHIDGTADVKKLKECGSLLTGTHDFKAFCASGSSVLTTERTVYEIRVEETSTYGAKEVDIYVCGNGFLYNMVRTIVGEMLGYMQGKKTGEDVRKALETGDRNLVGKTMPAKGLTLYNVEYDGMDL